MPIVALKEGIAKYLKEIDYKVSDYTFSPTNTLKYTILEDPSVSVNIYSKNAFYVQLNRMEFYEVLANTFYYNYARFNEQNNQIQYLLQSQSSAWLLTTIYYSCFFAANEINNLHGVFNFSLTNDEKKKLISKNISMHHQEVKDFIIDGPNHFKGSAKVLTQDNTIQISFQSGGGKPHELTWKNLSEVLKIGKRDRELGLTQRIRIKNILANEHKWKRPNQIRNEWNYAQPELYMDEGKIYKNTIIQYLGKFSEIKNWASKISSDRKNVNDDVISIIFLFEILKSVMEEYKLIIFDEEL